MQSQPRRLTAENGSPDPFSLSHPASTDSALASALVGEMPPPVPPHRVPWLPRLLLAALLVAIVALAVWIWTLRVPNHWEDVARARRLLEAGRIDEAFEAVANIRDEGPGAAEGLTLAGRALLLRGNVSPARRVLERSLAIKREQPEAAKLLAAIYIAAGDGRRGIAMLQDAARHDPSDFRPWYAMGKVHHDLGELAESIAAYRRALERSPPDPEARECRLGRARALLDANQAEQAGDDLNFLMERGQTDPAIFGLAARQARELGELDQAAILANRALELDPDNLDALVVRARIRFANRDPLQARQDLLRAVRVNPNDAGTLQLLAQVERSLGLHDEAEKRIMEAEQARNRLARIEQLTHEIEQRPEDPEPRWRLGEVALEGRLYTLAYQCFQASLDLDPSFRPAREALARLRSRDDFHEEEVMGTRPGLSPRTSPTAGPAFDRPNSSTSPTHSGP
jgi:tetratricopeptide (TPR) repeat protein